ncbi:MULTISPECIES: hypothetical protein [unclassified Bradyrhizobium]|uniref:hypothetical protein n=1 Tax=unclassified Bradyrhizobium TaxID=2631580 RepID=UPI003390FAB9
MSQNKTKIDVYFHHTLFGMGVYMWVAEREEWVCVHMHDSPGILEDVQERLWLYDAATKQWDVTVHERDHIYCHERGITPARPQLSNVLQRA